MNRNNSIPLFSVVTVCFNSIDTIQDTIDSVASQTGVSLEHIIIDGGSTDGTYELINSQREKFSTVISEPDKGIYDAMQKGLIAAIGEYTGFLNADDYFSEPASLYKLSLPLRQSGKSYVGLTAALEQINKDGKVKRIIGRKPFNPKDILWGKFPPHPATYLKTTQMKSTGGFDSSFRISGDFDMFLAVLCQNDIYENGAIGHVPERIVKMRLGGMSTSGLLTYLKITKEFSRALSKNNLQSNPVYLYLRGIRKLSELLA